MDNVQAKAIMALATAYFPVPALSPSTETAWAETLLALDHAAALKAVRELGKHGMPYGRPFHVSELVARTEAVQREADQVRIDYAGRDALEAIVPASEDEKRAILAAYWERVGVDREVVARVKHAARSGDVDGRIEAARVLARRRIEGSATAAEGAETPPREADPVQVLRTACGAEAGTQAVQSRDGTWVCPRCGSPVKDGCERRGTA